MSFSDDTVNWTYTREFQLDQGLKRVLALIDDWYLDVDYDNLALIKKLKRELNAILEK